MPKSKPKHPVLKLVAEYKLWQLLRMPEDTRLEASGVCTLGADDYVVFDNTPDIARLGTDPVLDNPRTKLLRRKSEAPGYEDITYNPHTKRFYALIEGMEHKGRFHPRLAEFDARLRHIETNWMDFEFEAENKGFEGVTYFRHAGKDYILCLCEGNKCRAGKRGRKPGGGRIHAFVKGEEYWEHVATIKVPKSVRFTDYASIEASGARLAFVSQESAAVWIGELDASKLAFVDDGETYEFPRDDAGEVIYCNVEGVTWVTPTQLLCTSDRAKRDDQSKRCCQKEMSAHLFDLPH
jgi:hypothetical protein